MKRFILGFILAISIPVMAAVLWPSGSYLETFQNGFIFGTGKVLSVLNDVITFDGNRLDDRNKDIFYQEDFEGASVSFVCGSDLTAADETAAPIKGTSKSFTQGATPPTIGVKCESAAITLSPKEQDKNIVEVCFNSEWNGNNNEMALNIYGNTSAANLVQVPITASSTPKKHCGYFTTSGEVSIDYHIEVLTQNANKKLLVDSIQFKVDPLTPTDIYASSEPESYTPSSSAGFGTLAATNLKWARSGSYLLLTGNFTTGTVAASIANIALPDGLVIATGTPRVVGSYFRSTSSNTHGGSVLATAGDSFVEFSTNGVFGGDSVSAVSAANGDTIAASGGTVHFSSVAIPIAGWSDTAQGVVVKNRSDSASVENDFTALINDTSTCLVQDQTPVNWLSCSVLTTNQCSCTVNSSIFSTFPNFTDCQGIQGGEAICDSISGLGFRALVQNANGTVNVADNMYISVRKKPVDYIKETDKVYTVPVDTLTGSYLKADSNAGTAITANTTNMDWSNEIVDTSDSWDGTTFTAPKYGFYTVEGTVDISGASSFYIFAYVNGSQDVPLGIGPSAGEKKFNGVIRLNEGDTLTFRSDQGVTLANSTIHSLIIKGEYGDRGTFLGTFGQPTCYVKDVKATNTSNDNATGSWQTLDLSNTEGDCSFLSLASNAFTLEAGSYNVVATVPAYRIDSYQVRIQNTSDASTAIIGNNGFSSNADNGETLANAKGRITISASKTFEFQGIASNTGGTWGTAYNSGISNVYSMIEITKVR